MGQALYRKYRSKSLSEIVGQEHITETLASALKQGRISHAYLFTGPRGVGKTSIARILAHEVNGLPYTSEEQYMDIIEIDAASNRRIDEIRELREKAYVAPTSAKYKVYIIDEVHMLTREAFNALLKLLEEPPAHVIFILATTDAHKLPDTIVSRTQRFSFQPVDKAQVVAHLRDIAKQEKIVVSDEALELLAEHGEGSFRDSISLLDQAQNQDQKLEASDVQRLLGVPPTEAIQDLLRSLNTNTANLMSTLTALYDQGFQAAAIAKQLGQLLRRQLVSGQTSLPPEEALELLSQLIEVPVSHDPERFLEIVLLRARQTDDIVQVAPVVPKQKAVEPEPLPSAPEVEAVDEPEPIEEEPAIVSELPPEEASKKKSKPSSGKKAPLDAVIWQDVLQALKKKHNTLYSVVRMAEPVFTDDGNVELHFAFAFHQKRISETANRQVVADVIHQLTGKAVSVNSVLDPKVKVKPPKKLEVEPEKKDLPKELNTISNIFGGGELLES